jgi:hypothetical protein
MALPGNLVAGLLPTEAEFVATSSVEISVVPLMKIDKVRLLSGVYGPLRPPTQARLPLWLALNLKKRKRCSIICPDWMQLGEHHRDLAARIFVVSLSSHFACREPAEAASRRDYERSLCASPLALHIDCKGATREVGSDVL